MTWWAWRDGLIHPDFGFRDEMALKIHGAQLNQINQNLKCKSNSKSCPAPTPSTIILRSKIVHFVLNQIFFCTFVT
jgi:hypothetical protein